MWEDGFAAGKKEAAAKLIDTAALLDRLAERIEGLIQKPDPHGWRTEPTEPFILAAAYCRAEAKRLRGET